MQLSLRTRAPSVSRHWNSTTAPISYGACPSSAMSGKTAPPWKSGARHPTEKVSVKRLSCLGFCSCLDYGNRWTSLWNNFEGFMGYVYWVNWWNYRAPPLIKTKVAEHKLTVTSEVRYFLSLTCDLSHGESILIKIARVVLLHCFCIEPMTWRPFVYWLRSCEFVKNEIT